MQEPQIIKIGERKLIGMRLKTSLSENRTFELWKKFKSRVGEIKNRTNEDFYSLQIYEKGFQMKDFTPQTQFEKWAAVEIENAENVPPEMEVYQLEAGEYAVFIHRGTPADFPQTAGFIYGVWLPKSGYELDERPHFEILGEKYILNDPNSEEEVWIPIKRKI